MLFHVTTKNLGNTVDIEPRIMEDIFLDIEVCASCWAPSLAQCIIAIPSNKLIGNNQLFVYSTEDSSFEECKESEWDIAITEEKRFYNKAVSANLVGFISVETKRILKEFLSENSGLLNYSPRKLQLQMLRLQKKAIENYLAVQVEYQQPTNGLRRW